MMKKFIILLLTFCILSAMLAGCGDEIQNDPPSPSRTVSSQDAESQDIPEANAPEPDIDPLSKVDTSFVEDNGIGYIWDQLDSDTKLNLAEFMNAVKNLDMVAKLTVGFPVEESDQFLEFAYNCTMDYTYIGTSFAAPPDDDGIVRTVYIPYNMEVVQFVEDGVALTDALNSKLDEIIAAMPDGTQWEQIKYLHDYLIFNCNYGEDGKIPFTAYGALVDGSATCQGYADAMHLLLARAGFETCFTIGRGDNINYTHKWNYVKLDDGKWYILDPTWADPTGKTDPDYICYDYFMISDDVILQDHAMKFDNAYYKERFGRDYYYQVPSADSMELSYHNVMGYYCTTYEEAYAATQKQLALCAKNGTDYIYLRMSDEDVYTEVNENLFMKAHDGEIQTLMKEANEAYGSDFNDGSWERYSAHKDGQGPLTIIITLKHKN